MTRYHKCLILKIIYLTTCLQGVSRCHALNHPHVRAAADALASSPLTTPTIHTSTTSCIRCRSTVSVTPLQASVMNDDNDQESHSVDRHRRTLLSAAASASSSSLFLVQLASMTASLAAAAAAPLPAQAATTVVEGIRQSASSIPGYGPSNIYYPSYLLGKFRATHVIVDSMEDDILGWWNKNTGTSTSSSTGGGGGGGFPLTLFYNVRFVAVEQANGTNANGNDNDAQLVIADRLYNQESYYKALRAKALEVSQQATSSPSSSLAVQVPPPLQRVDWNPSNPNVLTELYTNGSSREVKVTKRKSDMQTNDNNNNGGNGVNDNVLISSSEYRRITTVSSTTTGTNNGVGGIPTLKASRVLTKWNVINSDLVEGIELIYAESMLGGGGDPMSSISSASGKSSATSGPQVISKSRIRLQRIKDGTTGGDGGGSSTGTANL